MLSLAMRNFSLRVNRNIRFRTLQQTDTLARKSVRFYTNSGENHLSNAIQLINYEMHIPLELAVARVLDIESSSIRQIKPGVFYNGITIRFKPSVILNDPQFLCKTSMKLISFDVDNIVWSTEYEIEIKSHGVRDFISLLLKVNRS